mmetsp:Transcript_10775/g.15867  ORF Transcript_10775/g.15867 Transcript_10775/m.15867 type:complete len:299 (+) Transcript_10775:53-949(+)
MPMLSNMNPIPQRTTLNNGNYPINIIGSRSETVRSNEAVKLEVHVPNTPNSSMDICLYSAEQNRKLTSLEDDCRERFPPSTGPNDYYESAQSLKNAVLAWSTTRGFHVRIQGSSIQCGKHDAPNRRRKEASASKKQTITKGRRPTRITNVKRCSCPFVIRFSPARNATNPSAPSKAVRITKGSKYRHDNGCYPCVEQLVSDSKSSGLYTRRLCEDQLSTVIKLVQMGEIVPAKAMRTLLRPLFPPSIPITSQLISNVKFKVQRMLKKKQAEEEMQGFAEALVKLREQIVLEKPTPSDT